MTAFRFSIKGLLAAVIPKARWFRFSLKTLLVVITVFCVLCFWFVFEVHRANKLRRAREATSTPNSMHGTKSRFPSPDWLRELMGEEYFIDIDELELDFVGKHMARGFPKESALAHLDAMPRLERLVIKGDRFTDKGMHLIPPLGELLWLEIWHGDLSADGIGELTKFKKLRILWLDSKHFTDDDLQPVAALRTLEELVLNDTKITDKGLEIVTHLPNLKELDLERTPITDSALKHLVGLRRLEFVSLCGSPGITADGVARLQLALPNCTIRHDFE